MENLRERHLIIRVGRSQANREKILSPEEPTIEDTEVNSSIVCAVSHSPELVTSQKSIEENQEIESLMAIVKV